MSTESSGSVAPQSVSLTALVRDNPAFGILVAGQWVSTVGNQLTGLALVWLVLSLTHSRAALGLVAAAGEASGLAMIFAGVYVDRWRHRRTLVTTDMVRAAMAFALFALAATHHLDLGLIVVIVIVSRVAGSFFTPAAFAFMQQLVEKARLPRATGLLSSTRTSAGIVGQLLAGALLSALGPASLFFLDALTFVASVGTLARIGRGRPDPPVQERRGRSLWREVVDGQQDLWRNRFLRRLVPLGMIMGFFSIAVFVLDVAWVRQVLHGGPLAFAGFWVAAGVGGVAGGLASGRLQDRFTAATLTIVPLVLGGLSIVALSRIPVLAVNLPLMFILGTALAVQSTALNVLLQQMVSPEVIGRSIGAVGALTGVTSPLGAVAAGVAATLVSLSTVLLVSGIMVAVSALGLVGMSRPEPVARDCRGVT